MITLKIAQYVFTIILAGFGLFFVGRCMWEIWPEMTIVVVVVIGAGLSIEGYKFYKKKALPK